MKRNFVRFSSMLLLIILLYGVVRMNGVRVPILDRCVSYCVYPLLTLQNALVSPIKQYIEMTKIHHEIQEICARSLHERQELIKENIELTAALDVLHAVEELEDFKKRYSTNLSITSQVISRHFDQRHFFWIDAGKNRGVEVDMVVVYKNCLVGRVSEVFPYYSKVILITDPLCKVAAFCKSSQANAIHEGAGSLYETKLTYIFDSKLDLDKRLKKGDLVLSSGEGLIFPKGFGLGKIESFHAEDLQFNVTLAPLIDFNTIEYCSVISKGAEYLSPQSESPKSSSTKQSKPVKVQAYPIEPSKSKVEPSKVREVVKEVQIPVESLPDQYGAGVRPSESHLFSPLPVIDDGA